jgi:hypothetical protein
MRRSLLIDVPGHWIIPRGELDDFVLCDEMRSGSASGADFRVFKVQITYFNIH